MSSTAVRVALRVRPLTEKEQLTNCSECIAYIPDEPQILIGTDKSFTFDHVFPGPQNQEQVYTECAQPLLKKFTDGFNVTILAYGQTGSGKTYSMGTSFDNGIQKEQQGIVPRFISDLFAQMEAQKLEMPEFQYEISVSFLELYNEDLIDLLNRPQTSRRRSTQGIPPAESVEVSIHEDVFGNIYWKGVREEPCSDPEELFSLLQKGSLCRTTGSTDMNAVSSRSHAIFSVILKQQQPPNMSSSNLQGDDEGSQSRTLLSKFHFVDLAGSERLKRTNAQGDRAKEGISINSGLLALGNVISALGDESRRAAHVPYRDSKLTRLLQDSLGGNSQTLMLACVSPADTNFMETLNTLKYANRARNIKNRVTINQEFAGSSIEVNQLRAQIARLKMENTALRSDGGSHDPISSHLREEETRGLRREVVRLRDRMQEMSNELLQATSERDTLLMERELGNFMPTDLDELIGSEGLIGTPSEVQNTPPAPVQQEGSIKTHPIIQHYLSTIQNLKSELTDTQDRLAFMESVKAPMMHAMSMTNGLSTSTTLSGITSQLLSGANRERYADLSSQMTTSSSSNRKKYRRKHRKVRMGQSNSSSTAKSRLPAYLQEAKNRNTDDEGIDVDSRDSDEMEDYQRTTGEIRRGVKSSIDKARNEIMKGMAVLQSTKNDENPNWEDEFDAYQASQRPKDQTSDQSSGDEIFSSLKVGEHTSSYGDWDKVLLDGTEKLEVPTWSDNGKVQTSPPNTARNSVSSEDVSIQLANVPRDENYNPNMVRMLHQIQSDIQVKEELVSHLEKSEMQYTFMRKKFEEQLASQQHAMNELQRERDIALRRATPNYVTRPDAAAQLRDKQQLLEVRHAYEAKMKRLFAETQELRRKYSQTARAMQSTRNQNDSMLRTLKVNVETLKVEKRRMIKRMKQDAMRVKEQLTAQERQIQLLRRKQAEVSIAKKRLEREHESQRRTLKRRDEEILMSNEQLKHLVNVLKKAVREGGVLDERLLNKVTGVIGGRFAIMSRGRSAFAAARKLNGKPTRRQNPVPVQLRLAKKKELLDIALYKYIEGKQAIVEMEQLLYKRECLAEEKAELTAEREQFLASERLRAMETDEEIDSSSMEYLDDRIELVSAEISYLSARIKAIQHDAANDAMVNDPMAMEAAQRQRMTKHVTFADEIIPSNGKDGWTDIDTLDDRYSLPYNAGPEMAYDTSMQLIKSLESDESRKLAQALVEDLMILRMEELGRQTTVQTLEKTVQDLRRTLLIMKRVAVSNHIKSEHQLQKVQSRHAVSTEDDANELRMKIEASINNGNTIFDRIYENGIRGTIMSPDGGDQMTNSGQGSPISGDDVYLSTPLMSPTRRSSNFQMEMRHGHHLKSPSPSPDRLLSMAQKHTNRRSIDGDVGLGMNDFMKYAGDRDSSTSSIRSNHIRRSSITSDSSLQSWNNVNGSARRRAHSLQQQPQPQPSPSRRRPSFRELSHGRRESMDMISPPSPYATMSYQRNFRRAPSVTSPNHSVASNNSERAMTPNGTVFDRLAQVHTHASQAKMSHRYSSGSVEELKLRWSDYERSGSAMSGSYFDD
ncbi:hypothetical protein INT43_006005 [Umbelopsis isabellina]|uniref:Kinesin motor domain-containing protein n=1 Tax=Mortierella isabellina TaxID=91625 RepID=A0A8H7PJC9_MORIS|nr:hypothetical protein INT43_006005 [Umbelopsis isabellina]